jgi:hypothetical protein
MYPIGPSFPLNRPMFLVRSMRSEDKDSKDPKDQLLSHNPSNATRLESEVAPMSRLFRNRTRIAEGKRSFKSERSGRSRGHGGLLYRVCLPVALVVAIALATASGAFATTIIVNSTADPGASGICALRDAITAANTRATTNGCVAGTGTDTVRFSMTGKIALASTLPAIAGNLSIIGAPVSPGITIDGGGRGSGAQIMIVNSGAAVTLQFLTLVNGFNVVFGGGAVANNGTLTIANSTFSGNDAAEAVGGAIYNTGTLTVTNSTFSANFVEADFSGMGGAIYNTGMLSITNSTFSDNQAAFSVGGTGGAIDNDGTLTIANSTFWGNAAPFDSGGAINSTGTLTVTNSTFSANVAGAALDSVGNGAISFYAGSVRGSILADNSGGNCSGRPTDVGYNISDDTTCGFSGTGAMGQKLGDGVNPLLDPKGLQNNGGPTQTIALQSTSPAVDAIPFASCTDQATPPHQLKNDQRGKPRPDPADGATGPCDVGAYEFQTPGPIITAIPKVILTGDEFNITGQNFTAGSVVNLFVVTSTGVVNDGPLTPTARSLPTQLTVGVPIVGLGNGFASVQVVNTDEGYLASNSAPALLQADPSKTPFPTITSINGHPLADTSSDPRYAVNNVETLVVPGKVVTLGGMGFGGGTLKSSVDLFCACPGGKVGPFAVTPTSSTSISFTLPATGPNAPVTGPGSFVITDTAPAGLMFKSNAVSVPIGDLVSVKSVLQSVSPPDLITVNGTGFSTLTVINFFNKQGIVVKNLGGLKPDGSKAISLTLVNDKQFTFTVPAGAVAGAAYVQGLNPPFVPFASSDNDPGGAFTLK